jgi:ATP-binding cassette subfamily C protein LapB
MTDAVREAEDALLSSVLWLCRHHGIERSRASLLSPLGLVSPLNAVTAQQVLREAGFQASLVERDPAQILTLLLPVILLLHEGQACVLMGREVRDGAVRFRVLIASAGEAPPVERWLDEAALLAQYSGHALIAMPVLAEGRSADAASAGAGEGHWLWQTLRRYVPYYRGAMLAAMLSNVLMLFTGLFTSVVYDRVIPHQAMTTLWALAIGATLAVAFDLAARQLRSHLIDHAGRKSDLALGARLFRQSLSIRLEHRPDSSGSFAHHMAQLEVVREFSTSATMSALSDLPFVLLFIGVTWLMAGPLALVLVVAVPLILLLTVGVQHWLRRSMTAQQRQFADMQGLLVETVEGIETIRACGAQGYFQRQYEEANAAAAQASLRARTLSSWVSNVTMVSQQFVTVVMLVWGVHLIRDGQLTGGALISAVMFAGRTVAPLGSVVALASRYQGARAALRMLDQLMALPSDREPGRRYLASPQIQGALGLREAGFAYGQPSTHPVLKGVDLRIRAGERVAILGKIGSGKSTALRLLAGLYQPTQGAAEVDGIDLRQIDPADYRVRVGFVEQEPRLFRGSLRDNILLGRDSASPEALSDVLHLTGLDRIAATHPQGLDMPVGEGGAMLSGGQRQLVALARCLVTRPSILLMDEPTSSMDAQTEQQFVQHLKRLLGPRTLVVVTHRPAMLELVDRIVVLDGGRVLADGPKAAVLQVLSGQRPAAASANPPPVVPVAPAAEAPSPPTVTDVAAV